MTTYNATTFSSTLIVTDLQLYFELTRNIYTQDPEFAERWNEWIVDMVKDRLWSYSDAVMTTPIGDELFEGVIEELEEMPLNEVYEVFAKEEGLYWSGTLWVDKEEDDRLREKYSKVVYLGSGSFVLSIGETEAEEDDREDEEMSECDECGEEQPLGSFHTLEDEDDFTQKCVCDACFEKEKQE